MRVPLRTSPVIAGQAEISAQLSFEPAPLVRDLPSALNLQMMLSRAGVATILPEVALQVPAFVKAVKTFHMISAFPLREYVADRAVVARPFLRQPSKNTTYSAEMMRLIADVCMFDRGWWRITERTWDNFPSSIVRMPAQEVSTLDGRIMWNGMPVDERQVIRFDGDGLGGWLHTGATAITIAAALEAATLRYADSPLPTMILKNTGADLPEALVDDILQAWEEARAARSTAYLNSTIEAQPQGWNAAELQLVDAKNAAAVQISRMANLDPVWLGAGIPGSSLTYSNRIDLYRQLLDTALTPVMNLISQRLSMNDVTPRGHEVEFDTSVFLRGNPADLSTLIEKMLPLQVLTLDESRQLLDLPDMGVMQ